MKLTESQLKTIILEEAAKVKKSFSLKKQLQEVQKQLDEVMGGPHGEGKKTFKKPSGGDFSNENPGALIEDDMEEMVMPEEGSQMEEESFDFSEQELEEMLNMADGDELEEYGDEHHMSTDDALKFQGGDNNLADKGLVLPGDDSQDSPTEEEFMAEADKTSDPFTKDAPHKFNLKESTEALRMKKLAGLL